MPVFVILFVFALAAHADPQTDFLRTQAVLDHFKVPQEGDSQSELNSLSGRQSLDGLQKMINYFDLDGEFDRYAKFDGSRVTVFQDPDSQKIVDFQIDLAKQPQEPTDPMTFHQRLIFASSNPREQQLNGLKIAIDPGHMGGTYWDRLTGKYVSDGMGHIISEGVIALQTALLLEAQLKSLGAEVMLTRRSLAPVTNVEMNKFSLDDYARTELRESALESWFRSLLTSGPIGPVLYQAFDNSNYIKNIFSEVRRPYYFINRIDLGARSDVIQQFSPDITLIIHYDTNGVNLPGRGARLDPSGVDGTKAYVTGGFEKTEWASKDDRVNLAKHLFNPFEWNASLKLSRNVVHHLQQELNIPLDHDLEDNVREVEPGVLARNLSVSRNINGTATSYIECLFYTDSSEFQQLLDTPYSMDIDGTETFYSNRIVQVADAIRDGVSEFVSSYQK